MKDRKVPVYISMSPYTNQTVIPDSIFAQEGIEPRKNEGKATEVKVTPLNPEDLKAWFSPEGRLEKALSIVENSSPELNSLVQKYRIELLDENTYKDWSNGSLESVGLALISDRSKNWKGETRFSIIASSERVKNLSREELAAYLLQKALIADAGNNFTGTTAERTAYVRGIEDEMQAKALALLTENDNFKISRIHSPLLKASWQAYQASSQPQTVVQK